jgi:hypothetical protein
MGVAGHLKCFRGGDFTVKNCPQFEDEEQMLSEWERKEKNRLWRIASVMRRCFADVQRKYDWFIYKMAYNSIKRMCEKNPGMAYLMELNIRGWRENHPINDDLKHATEVFYDAMRRQNNVV